MTDDAIMESTNTIDTLDTIIPTKPKKFCLPKKYLRDSKINEDTLVNELELESPLLIENGTNVDNNEVKHEHLKISSSDSKTHSQNVKNNVAQEGNKETKKTRKPSAYNLFMKDTIERLNQTHKHLPYKERFVYATKLWNEQKTSTS